MFDIILRAIENFWSYINSPEVVESFFNNRFYTILAVVMLIRIKYATYNSMFVCALVNIPGTILHEFMHFIVGLFLNAQPSKFTIFPKKDPLGGYVTGSVSLHNITFYNAIPSSLAPLALLPISFYINRYVFPYVPHTILWYMGYILLQTIIIENAIPSRADFRIAFSYISGIILYGIVLIALLLML